MGFQTEIVADRFSDLNQKRRLRYPLVYVTSRGETLEIPKGFVTDGASIPFPGTLIWGHWGSKRKRAAVLHDYALFIMRRDQPFTGYDRRRLIDALFYEALRSDGVNFITANVFYYTVRVWGMFSVK